MPPPSGHTRNRSSPSLGRSHQVLSSRLRPLSLFERVPTLVAASPSARRRPRSRGRCSRRAVPSALAGRRSGLCPRTVGWGIPVRFVCDTSFRRCPSVFVPVVRQTPKALQNIVAFVCRWPASRGFLATRRHVLNIMRPGGLARPPSRERVKSNCRDPSDFRTGGSDRYPLRTGFNVPSRACRKAAIPCRIAARWVNRPV